ncbi:hypothetical protein Lesp02_52580 [Lentzea sp. NBRC 105346]|uniref:hypothetical protein n=1 Tax=Lentzea sp. NBRC 105346 TaxID=3032205 RepID=UPI0024A1E39E|nr:hypothetical protein [Lentzea sp. NBRC 105346]GLZ33070.1 hypothetical protein Lesp02_52580 [Lentzea sp. NBRC 105346]
MRAKTGVAGIRRFATRALVALGGAMAGTAIAWALSTSSASAQEAPQIDFVTKVVSIDGAVPTIDPAKKFVDGVDETLRAEQQKARAALPAGEVRDVVGKVADIVQPRLIAVVPTEQLLGAQTTKVPTPNTTTTDKASAEPVVVAPQSAGLSGAQWTKLLESHHAVVSDEQHPSLPADPSPKLPAPAPGPVQCGCSSGGSGSAGGSNSAAQAALGNAYDTAVARALMLSTDVVTVMPGKQPGITPD